MNVEDRGVKCENIMYRAICSGKRRLTVKTTVHHGHRSAM